MYRSVYQVRWSASLVTSHLTLASVLVVAYDRLQASVPGGFSVVAVVRAYTSGQESVL